MPIDIRIASPRGCFWAVVPYGISGISYWTSNPISFLQPLCDGGIPISFYFPPPRCELPL